MSVIFARHGETKFNVEGRLQGRSDSPLTSNGISQARVLGDFLSDFEVSDFLLSPMPRVLKTYEVCNKNICSPYTLTNDLLEVCYGEWEGQPKVSLKVKDLWQQRNKNRFNFRHPGAFKGVNGESYKDLYARLSPFFIKLTPKISEGSCTVVLGHLGVMRCVFKYFQKLSDLEAGQLEIPNNLVVLLSQENGNINFETRNL